MGRSRSRSRDRRDRERKSRDRSRSREREKKSSKRRRSVSSGSDGSREDRRHKVEKMTDRIAEHLQRHATQDVSRFGDVSRFADPTISERFVWKKKIENSLAEGQVDVRQFTARAERERQDERLREIEAVRKRREERELEKQQMEEELKLIERERARAEGAVLDRKEEAYHLENARVRAKIRLTEGRPEPFDLVLKNLFLVDDFGMDMDPPFLAFRGLPSKKLAEVSRDVATYKALNDELDGDRADYWEAMTTVVSWEHDEARAAEEKERMESGNAWNERQLRAGAPLGATMTQEEVGFHAQVDEDVQGLFADKSLSELSDLEAEIKATLSSEDAPDPEYWDAVLKRLRVHKARALLRDVHETAYRAWLQRREGGGAEQEGWGIPSPPREYGEAVAQLVDEAFEQHEKVFGAGERNQMGSDQPGPSAPRAANVEEIDLPDEEEEDGQPQPQQPPPPPSEDDPKAAAAAASMPPPPPPEPSRGRLPTVPEDLDPSLRGLSPDPVLPRQAISVLIKLDLVDPKNPPPIVDLDDDRRELAFLRSKVAFAATRRFGAATLTAAGPAVGPSQPGAPADQQFQQMQQNPGVLATGPSTTRLLREEATQGASGPAAAAAAAAAAGARRPDDGDGESGGAAAAAAGGAPTLNLALKAALGVSDKKEDEEFTKLKAMALKQMGTQEDGEYQFGGGSEVSLSSQVYWWHDKYKPRKPKYFNRVHTGYEWNKYNQTHYDVENPPPKVVMGYKFNIFYPDLIDRTKTPQYFIEKDPESVDGSTCVIRFHAGPPYEDVAFKVINKEWETAPKKGFRCVFERGILSLYFNFRRLRYRR